MAQPTVDPAGKKGQEEQIQYKEPYCLYGEDNSSDHIFFTRAFRNSNAGFPLVHRENGKLIKDFLLDRLKADDRLPNLVVLDIKMPGLSGLEVLEFIRCRTRLSRIPVVILSASAEDKDINKAYQNRVNAYLTKPERYSDLKQLVSTLATFWLDYNQTLE